MDGGQRCGQPCGQREEIVKCNKKVTNKDGKCSHEAACSFIRRTCDLIDWESLFRTSTRHLATPLLLILSMTRKRDLVWKKFESVNRVGVPAAGKESLKPAEVLSRRKQAAYFNQQDGLHSTQAHKPVTGGT
ncbi:hypothetical protein Bbelb_151320 [Branchiostoma belcheri]|nr:hypothetical protein Bbelb_151320 [Branchiostoma belcheri]